MRVLLVDFLAVYYRSYYGTSATNLVSKGGQLTFAIFSFLKTVIAQAKAFKADHVIICDDSKPLFRNGWFEDYKKGRPSKAGDDDFVSQRNLLRQHLPELGLPIIRVQGYEADDILATVAQTPSIIVGGSLQEVSRYRILTGDRDILALVGDRCEVLLYVTNGQQILYSSADDVKMVCKYGVYPSQFADYKALVGDGSDGIPGVKGFGPGAASKFFAEYTSLREAKQDQFQRLKPTMRTKIQESEDVIQMSYKLASLYPVADFAISFYEGSTNPGVFLRDFEFFSVTSMLEHPIWVPLFLSERGAVCLS